jgi:type II secretory pathway predicted ATPase ExeA
VRDHILEHFQLRRHPFSVEIEADALYQFKSFSQGLLRLEQATYSRSPVLVIAEPGSGKTALIRAFCSKLATSSFDVRSQLVVLAKNPIRPLLDGFLTGFGEQVPFNNPAKSLERLRTCLTRIYDQGRLPVLLIDDAHHLNAPAWLFLKALINYELDSKLPCLLIFMGKTETLTTLGLHELQEVRERLGLCFYMRPLKSEEIEAYLEKRLAWAGLKRSIFPSDIADQIWRHAQGNPRRINRLAEKCLLSAACNRRDLIDGICLEEAVSEMSFALPRKEDL